MRPRGGYGWRGGPVVGLAIVAVIFLAAASSNIFPFLFFFWWVIPAFLVPAVVLSARGVAALFEERSRRPMDEVRKEKELLEVLARTGEVTPARAALGTSLSVSEADRMLTELAKEGHVEVRAREGRLGYALWEHDRKGIE
ncbi:MAG: hypothetical protein ACRDTR_16905 [Rubrobacter sp.]